MSFADLGLSDTVLRAVEDAGYRTPTPIQQQAIPSVLQGSDVLGCAQTGTGKTAAFVLPMIDVLSRGRAKARMPRTLILEPTRELAAQVAENFETYGKYNKLTMALLIGGVSFDDQLRKIDRGVDVLIATPGRLLDHHERGGLLMRGVEIMVIDEADRMLDMGFIPDVERIVGLVNPNRQTLFFSATMPPEIKRLADRFLTMPKEITVAPPASPAETVEQALAVVPAADKRAALRTLLRHETVKNGFIFCNRKRDVDIVAKSLKSHGFDVAALHGDMSQAHRTETLEKFRNGEVKLLVCSDVAARGIDIAGMSHVFLFDVPIHAEDYVHRIGRTGRAGMRGHAYTLATPEDGKFVAAVETLIGKQIERITIEDIDGAELDDAEGGRRGRRGHGGKDEGERKSARRKPRKAEPKAAEPTEAPAEPVEAETEATREPGERRRKEPRGERGRGGRNERGGRGRGRREDKDEAVVGWGDHMPAFIARQSGL
jgi:superfamily II DNA/RNA helicase